jgi:tRNA threonylcarbamoyl adenosine modification protein YeaZ
VLLLAIDTSTPWVTVALARVGDEVAVLAGHGVDAPNHQGEVLAPTIAGVLRAAGVEPRQLSAIAVGLGPGPFTGLRAGVVTAAAMADALTIPAYGGCSLDAVTSEEGALAGERLVVTDARRKQVYWARYAGDGTRVDGPEIDAPSALADRFRGSVSTVVGPPSVLVGPPSVLSVLSDGAFAGYSIAAGRPEAARLAELVAPRVRERRQGERLTPAYLRRPDARPPGPPKPVTRP